LLRGESQQESGHGRNQDTKRCRFPKINPAMVTSLIECDRPEPSPVLRLFWSRETALPCPTLPAHQNQRNRVFSLFYGCKEVFSQKPGFWPPAHHLIAIAKFSLFIQPHPFNHPFDEQQ
jgi:hypothetical protein